MNFRLLGSIEVSTDGGALALGGSSATAHPREPSAAGRTPACEPRTLAAARPTDPRSAALSGLFALGEAVGRGAALALCCGQHTTREHVIALAFQRGRLRERRQRDDCHNRGHEEQRRGGTSAPRTGGLK